MDACGRKHESRKPLIVRIVSRVSSRLSYVPSMDKIVLLKSLLITLLV